MGIKRILVKKNEKVIKNKALNRLRNYSKKTSDNYFRLMGINNIEIKRLSSEQKKEVDEIWGGFQGPDAKYSYQTHELCYSATGKFNPAVLPEDFFRTYIRDNMNKAEYMKSWKDKNYLELYLPDVKFPKVIVRNVNGRYLDEKFNSISIDEANVLVKQYSEKIVKPSVDSGFGKDVKLYKEEGIDIIEKEFQQDFVVQERFKQSKEMALLNESSVNVVRVITMYIDEKPEVLMSGLRVGNVGAITDYSPTDEGTGTVICGITDDGTIREIGYNSCGKQVATCANGFKFGGHKIPDYKGMVDIALTAHSKMPMFKFIGWDMIVDEDDCACVMEFNLKGPGVLYYQWVNGPLFGEDSNRIHHIVNKLHE